MNIEEIAPQGVVGLALAWLTMRIGNMEARLDALGNHLGVAPLERRKRRGAVWMGIAVALGAGVVVAGCVSGALKVHTKSTSGTNAVNIRWTGQTNGGR